MYLYSSTDYIRRIMSMEESVQQVIMQSIQELETISTGSGTTSNFSSSGPDLDPQLQRILGELDAAIEAKDHMVQRCHELDMQVCTRAFGVDCFCVGI
jgi:protein HOOK3